MKVKDIKSLEDIAKKVRINIIEEVYGAKSGHPGSSLSCVEILTVLYKDYICTDIERIELEKTLNENEVNYQNELREKYNTDNLFKNKQKEVENVKVENENISVVHYKESFFRRIISKIKLFFNK